MKKIPESRMAFGVLLFCKMFYQHSYSVYYNDVQGVKNVEEIFHLKSSALFGVKKQDGDRQKGVKLN